MKKAKSLQETTSAKKIAKNMNTAKTVSVRKTKRIKRKKAESLKNTVRNNLANALNENELALPYYISESRHARHLFLFKENDECSLAIANIPPFLKLNALKDALNQILSPAKIESLEILKSSSLNNDLTMAYRSGIVRFSHVNDSRMLWKLGKRTSPISFGDASVCRTSIERSIRAYNAKFVGVEQMLLSVNDAVACYEKRKAMKEKTTKKAKDKPDDDGWVMVTKNGKHSFSGKVNRQVINESDEEEAPTKRLRTK